MMSDWVVDLVVLDDELQNMDELRGGVTVLDNDFLGPVRQHGIPVLHSTKLSDKLLTQISSQPVASGSPSRHGWRQNFQSLPDNCASLNCMRFEETMKNLRHANSTNSNHFDTKERPQPLPAARCACGWRTWR